MYQIKNVNLNESQSERYKKEQNRHPNSRLAWHGGTKKRAILGKLSELKLEKK